MESDYNWAAHCQALGIHRDELLQIAAQEGLPERKLSSRESEKLLKALKKYAAARDQEANAQGSLF